MIKTGNISKMNRIFFTGMALALLLFSLPCTALAFTATAQVDQTRITPQDVVSLQVIVDGGEADVDTSAISRVSSESRPVPSPAEAISTAHGAIRSSTGICWSL